MTLPLNEFFSMLEQTGKQVLFGTHLMPIAPQHNPEDAENFAETYQEWVAALQKDPSQLARLQQEYVEEHLLIMQRLFAGSDNEGPLDKRFSGSEWREIPAFNYMAQSYLATARLFLKSIDELQIEGDRKQRMRFFAKQYFDAIAPCNYLATNPEALKKAVETNGESLNIGLQNLKADMDKGYISMTDETAFEVGKNLAVSEGSVVFENELIQLIQYKPLTGQVYSRPLLIVPPCINKFYILDLRPENSLVRFAVEQGHTVFMVSWRNVKEDLGHLTWDHYVAEGVVKAIDAARLISDSPKINALGFCIGGTLLTSALAVLKAMDQDAVESLTLLAAFLDFSDVGDIGAYIDQDFVEKREREVGSGGVVPGSELAFAFASLRANELVWNYVVNNYLKGETPPAFDLLYWNSDSTNLPGPMYCYYIRNAYLENNIAKPDQLAMCGYRVDFGDLTLPAFVLATREDHIVPWRTAFRSACRLGGEVQFVLGASGHIAGVVNPASKNRRSYWDGKPLDPAKDAPESWFEKAAEVPGSWWVRWSKWLAPHGGKRIPAREKLGNKQFKPIEPAPGRYVVEKA
jgi:polyhydroxyalkanoate synthase